ncbi:uncharacterized protein N7482_002244 [Penicillium canariense]|uniref:Uncharacterized protein n=1 Tax=Penicillium canariense TaxID=189055 RepID=A0A9W9IHA2_9EURO|nr:uncharacterized protein N7482_002244 [Penicillium canariense]KAJ5176367.1 hypothetical protein N7482_002244 [Penicillium canariense]
MDQNVDMYGYLPSERASLFGIIFFSTSMIICILQLAFGPYKHYWMITLVLVALGEAIGWGGRLWAHFAPTSWMAFMIQICSLIVSPVFLSAADYVLFCKLIDKISPRVFPIPSTIFWVGFIICDIISLAIQTVGGVLVSSAEDYEQLSHGGDVMRSGIIFQFSNTVIFVVLLVGVILRQQKRRTLASQARWPVMTALCVSTLMVLIRNGYRIVELSDGWKGHLMHTERYLIGLDMVPMAVGIGAFVIFSPSFFLHEEKKLEINSMELSVARYEDTQHERISTQALHYANLGRKPPFNPILDMRNDAIVLKVGPGGLGLGDGMVAQCITRRRGSDADARANDERNSPENPRNTLPTCANIPAIKTETTMPGHASSDMDRDIKFQIAHCEELQDLEASIPRNHTG